MAENDLNASISTNYTHLLKNNDDDDWSYETLQQTRYAIQRIIVPSIVAVGIAGNLLTVIVLTR